MADRKKFSKEELKGIGFRIKASRVLTGLNQEEFGSKYNIPAPSIKTWEFGSVVPRLDGLTKFTDALRESGIYVSTNWLLHGMGTGPSYFLGQQHSESVVDVDDSFAELFKKSCKKSKENPVIVEIRDDEMVPLFKPGDLVAGVLLDRLSFKSDPHKPMLVNLGDGSYVVRYIQLVDDCFFLSSSKNHNIKKVNVETFACIRWHRSG